MAEVLGLSTKMHVLYSVNRGGFPLDNTYSPASYGVKPQCLPHSGFPLSYTWRLAAGLRVVVHYACVSIPTPNEQIKPSKILGYCITSGCSRTHTNEHVKPSILLGYYPSITSGCSCTHANEQVKPSKILGFPHLTPAPLRITLAAFRLCHRLFQITRPRSGA